LEVLGGIAVALEHRCPAWNREAADLHGLRWNWKEGARVTDTVSPRNKKISMSEWQRFWRAGSQAREVMVYLISGAFILLGLWGGFNMVIDGLVAGSKR
jgi:hypothetical protein